MARPQCVAASLHCLPVERFRLVVAAQVLIYLSKTDNVEEGVYMAWPQLLAAGLHCFPKCRFRFPEERCRLVGVAA
jgi:hypothetical protein